MDLQIRMGILFEHILLCFLTCPLFVLCQCPKDAFARSFNCANTIILAKSSENIVPVVGGGHLNNVRDSCRKNKYDTALECIEDLHTACKGKVEELIDVNAMRRAWENICDPENLMVYSAQAPCMRRNVRRITECFESAMEKGESLVVPSTGNVERDRITSMMAKVCISHDYSNKCIERVLRQSCSSSISKLLTSYNNAQTPQICSSDAAVQPSVQALNSASVHGGRLFGLTNVVHVLLYIVT
ncbi:unnamed protein product [Owenia fusiformis]|uniref:Uncharacterized protein n=1 Tax=Owenia fusiformis TaxID=6347 RepID=A0A8S4NP01_OWEFU|nr:unnamed protein product [Owenia fusiformis]